MAKQNNRKQASGKAKQQLLIDSLDDIGSSRSDYDTNVTDAIQIASLDFIERVKLNIQEEITPITGAIDDITLETYPNKVDIVINNHLLFQDKGVNGSEVKKYNTEFTYRDLRPPVAPFIQMIKDKNIQLRNEEFYRGDPSPFEELSEEKKIERVAWAISTHIYKNGFKPRNVYSKEIPQLETDLMSILGTITADTILSEIIITNDGSRVKLKKK